LSVYKLLCLVTTIVLLAPSGTTRAQPATWEPTEPAAEKGDWIKLTSGEWLNGEIQSLHDKNFEFDSDKLDLLKLDWDDVAELRSARELTYRFDDLGVFTGMATMRGDVVRIRVGDSVRELPRESLLMILEGRRHELDFWSAKVSVGFVGRSGNTDQADVNGLIHLRRETTRTRTNLKYMTNMGNLQGSETVNNQNASIALDAMVTAGFFVTPFSLDYFRDPFQNIKSRFTIGAGAGYTILRGGDVEWSIGLGGGYLTTQLVSAAPGEDEKESTGVIVPSTGLEWDVNDNVELALNYDAKIGVPEVKETFHHAFALVSVDVIGDYIDLDVSLTWDRNETPKADAEGIVPVRDDFRTSVGIGVDF